MRISDWSSDVCSSDLDIPDLLPNLFLLDVIGDAEDFVFRLAGSRVEEAFSMSLRGRSIAEIHKAAGMPIPVAQHIEVARGGGPRYREDRQSTRLNSRHYRAYRIPASV